MNKSISRASVDLFCECPRCFYLQHRFGLKRPPVFPFTLNAAVDRLTKMEFDIYRKSQTPHPLIKQYELDLIPLEHKEMENWRNSRRGIRTHYYGYDFYGVLDDIWVNQINHYWHVVDFKATAKKEPVVALDDMATHHRSYQRQISFYNWLLKQNGYPVSDISYFLYSTGDNQAGVFNDQLTFRTSLIEYKCDTSWVDSTLRNIVQCLESSILPRSSATCQYCIYRNNAQNLITILEQHDSVY